MINETASRDLVPARTRFKVEIIRAFFQKNVNAHVHDFIAYCQLVSLPQHAAGPSGTMC